MQKKSSILGTFREKVVTNNRNFSKCHVRPWHQHQNPRSSVSDDLMTWSPNSSLIQQGIASILDSYLKTFAGSNWDKSVDIHFVINGLENLRTGLAKYRLRSHDVTLTRQEQNTYVIPVCWYLYHECHVCSCYLFSHHDFFWISVLTNRTQNALP